MKKLFLFALSLLFATAHAHQTEVYAGPHFNYMRISFNNPSHLEGYAAGITTGIQYVHSYFRGSLDFEGTWNAGPITGEPAQRSSIYEYFLDLNLGPTFSWNRWQFQPYTGFGWDRFNNKQNPSGSALSFRYDKLFVPVGFYVNWMTTMFKVGLQFEFRPDVYQNLKLIGIDLDPSWGYAFRTQLLIKQFFSFSWGRMFVNVIPFFDWNRFGKIYEENSVGATLDISRLLYWKLGARVLVGVEF
ncbi:MAG: outer membrane beta-barrel protein [Chlamydiota bacterium]